MKYENAKAFFISQADAKGGKVFDFQSNDFMMDVEEYDTFLGGEMSNENEIIQVSVCCLVYNHEPYLRKCLDGFMMQQGVTFEVLIHDDASTDHSADIIREYEKKYPNIIKPIYQTENQYSKGVKISTVFQYPRARGRYIALCEGDDYWTDPEKLKKQFEAMEDNPQCSACFHTVQGVAADSLEKSNQYPVDVICEGIIPCERYYNALETKGHLFQTSSYFFRTKLLQSYYEKLPVFAQISPVGDITLLLFAISKGSFYYYSQIMSCYRENAIGSWSSRIMANRHALIRHKEQMISVFEEYDKYIQGRYSFERKILRDKVDLYIVFEDYCTANALIRQNPEEFSYRLRWAVWIHAKFPLLGKVCKRLIHGGK